MQSASGCELLRTAQTDATSGPLVPAGWIEMRRDRPALPIGIDCGGGTPQAVGRYSREQDRGHDTYNISQYDLWDTYLAQYCPLTT